MCCCFVTGLGDEKGMITPPELNHLQAPARNCPGRIRSEAARSVDNGRPDTQRGCIMEQMEQPGEACLSLCRGKFLELLKEGRWEYVRRVNASGAVMIVAVTKEGELLLV